MEVHLLRRRWWECGGSGVAGASAELGAASSCERGALAGWRAGVASARVDCRIQELKYENASQSARVDKHARHAHPDVTRTAMCCFLDASAGRQSG